MQSQPAPRNMSVLAHHLDAVLASCGDLLQLPEPLAEPTLLATSVRVLELSTIMHLLQARHCAKQLGREDPRFASDTSHFLAETAHLPEMAKNFGNSTGEFFARSQLSNTPKARAEAYKSKAAHFGVLAALAKWPETSELWQTLQKSYLRLAAIEGAEAVCA